MRRRPDMKAWRLGLPALACLAGLALVFWPRTAFA
jgi:hypothetical protein